MLRNIAVAGLLTMAALRAQQPSEEAIKLAANVDKALGLYPGMIVADIGTGDALQQPMRIAGQVAPSGKVVCVDVTQSVVDKLKARIENEHISNIEAVLGKEDDPMLAPGTFDAVLISNSYHEFTHPETMAVHIRDALKAHGTLVVVENYTRTNRSESRAVQTKRHDLALDILERELTAAGFTIKDRMDPVFVFPPSPVNSPDRFRYLVRAEKTE